MMRVVFNDLRRETFTSVGGVIQIDAQCSKINGRYTNVWMLKLSDGVLAALSLRSTIPFIV